MSGSYNFKVLATGPIAYWPQSETAGTIAYDLVNNVRAPDPGSLDGTYTGPTLANDNTGPFGTPAPLYDGINDLNDVQTAALAAAFNGTVGTMMAWVRVSGVGVWADGSTDVAFEVRGNAANILAIYKPAAANTINGIHLAGGVADIISYVTPVPPTAFFHMALTWDKPGDAAILYYQGAPVGAAATLGVWAGLPAFSTIGCEQTGPGLYINFWNGPIGPCAIWDRALPLAEIASLALV